MDSSQPISSNSSQTISCILNNLPNILKVWSGGERGSMDQMLGQSPAPQLLCPVALQVLFYATSLSFHSIEWVIELHKVYFFIWEVK